ncbi:MAG TPA: hypothetical protein PLZ99_01830 [Parcubacteria group bacterium]|jgi:hypothetical protein|nr:hypothetical protein [Parcubacteria group bacterium]
MQIPEYMLALTDFGGYVNRAAVKFGGKRVLATTCAVSVTVIENITAGNAHMVDKEDLTKIATVCCDKLGQNTLPLLLLVIEKIHPNREVGMKNLRAGRISTPLSSAERRPQMVGK